MAKDEGSAILNRTGFRIGPEAQQQREMNEHATARYRRWGLRPVVLLLVVSFMFIPVRCNASSAPHSIFVDPVVPERTDAHAHHLAATAKPGESTPAGHHHHHHGAVASSESTEAKGDLLRADTSKLHCPFDLPGGSDAQSQQPVGGSLDLPTTPVAPDLAIPLPLDGERVGLTNAPTLALSGIPISPDSPPPKTA